MRTLGLHIEKPTLVHVLIYLLILNLFWSLILIITPLMNVHFTSPMVVIAGACFIWHTVCSLIGIEASVAYPKNIAFHLLGSIVTFIFIADLVDYLSITPA